MVTQLWEVTNIKKMLDTIALDLDLAPDNRPPFGMMIEVPGVLWQLNDYLPLVDFFSFGTNDLVQYLLCVDRNSSHVGHLYCEHHPVVIRFMSQVFGIVQASGKALTVCGEMAGSPIGILILLALGFRSLSVVPQRAYVVRYISKRVTPETLGRIREYILQESNSNFIQSFLTRELEKIHPDLLAVE
jgi:phosphotransferase system enzyme I (PtsP)